MYFFKQIPAALVLSEEKLFVTSCRPVGSFFGQFMRRPIEEMDEMDAELYKVYSNLEDLSLLYDDYEDHIGDFAVIKWDKDKQLYRAQIIQELSNETVNLIHNLRMLSLVSFNYLFSFICSL